MSTFSCESSYRLLGTAVPGPVDDAALAVVRSGFTPVLSTTAPGVFAAAFERGLA